MRRRAKVDKNQPEIVEALVKAGARVCHLHQLGQGVPDILVGYHGRLYLMELKSEGGTLTPDEKEWHDRWTTPVYTVFGIIDALKVIGAVG